MGTTFDSYNQGRSEPFSRRRATIVLLLLVAALSLIVLDELSFLDPVKSRAQAALRPVTQTLTQTRLVM